MLEDFLMNFKCIYLDEGKGGYTIACISAYICIGTQSAFASELLDGCLRNLVGMKYSWPRTCGKTLRQTPPRGGSRVGQK